MIFKYILSFAQLRTFLGAFLICFASTISTAQIVSGDVKEDRDEKVKKEKKIRNKVERDSLTGTTYYLTGMYSLGHRKFEDRSPFDAYASWNNQTPGYSGGVSVGLLMPLNKFLSLDLGFTYFGHREDAFYESPSSDSTYSFSNTYMQVGVPLKLRYTYGDKFQFFAFAGMTPVNILNVRFNESYTKANGTSIVSETAIIKEKLSIFNVMATAGLGITYNLDWIGFTLYPEYRHSLINTYDLQALQVDHKMFSLALNLGMTLRF
jgi:hypothetical protein